MYKWLISSYLIIASMSLIVNTDGVGEEYRNWCAQIAGAEMIAPIE
jgi:hypothetical protein